MKKKFILLSKKIVQHELIAGSSYLFLGTFFANVLAFLFNLLVIRKLTYAEYGTYASLIALFTLLTIPSASLTTVVVKFATEFLSRGEKSHAKKLYIKVLKGISIFSGIFFLGFMILSPFVGNFLHVTNIILLLFVGILICIAYISISNNAYLQSIFRFDFIAFTTLLGALIRLVVGVFFLYIGLRLYGIFIAIVLAVFIPYILSFIPLRLILAVHSSTSVKISTKEIFKFGLPAAISILSLSSLISADVLLVKHFFTPSQAGIYAGLSLVGKVILYFTAPIPSVMFPLLVKRTSKGENTTSLFLLSAALVLVPSFVISLGYIIFPSLVITIFLGGKGYLAGVPYLGLFAIFITLYSVLNVIVNFFLSLNLTRIAYILGFGAMLQIGLIVILHDTFSQVLLSSICSTLVVLIALLIYYGKEYGFAKKVTPNLINNSSV